MPLLKSAALGAALLAGLAGAAEQGEPRIVGHVEAVVDGQPVTWKSFATGDEAGALWRRVEGNRGSLTLSAFELTGTAFTDPGWEGSQLNLQVEFPLDGTTGEAIRVAEGPEGPAIHYIPRAGNYKTMLKVAEGELTIDKIARTSAQGYRLEGSFEGELVHEDEPAGRISAGRFRIERAEQVQAAP